MFYTEAEWEDWRDKLRQTVSERRYEHCLRVAEEAAALARNYGFDEAKARQAGLLHDVARDLPLDELMRRALEYGIAVGAEEQANPIILHAPVGAAMLEREWQITDAQLLRAVELHTVAVAGMDGFSQLLYLADLIEPGRKKWPELQQLRVRCYRDLDAAMTAALAGNLRYLQACGTFVHPHALAAYDFFRVRCHVQE